MSDNAAVSNIPRWMISFADLLSLILTFFVLMYSMSNPTKKFSPNENKLDNTSQTEFSLKQAEAPTEIKIAKQDQDLSTNYLYDVIAEKIAPYPELAAITLTAGSDKLTLSMPYSEFGQEQAYKLALIFKTITNRAEIYCGNIDEGKAVADKLFENGVGKKLPFLESNNHYAKIDIVIYP